MRVVRHRNLLPREIVDAPFGSVQGWVAWSFEKTDLAKDVPAHGRRGVLHDL